MSKVTSKDGTTIAFDRTGTGPALIVVDGAMCYRAFGPAASLAPLLAPHFTVYTYDRRGRGESGDTAPYAVEREVEDLAALIDAAGGSAGLLGFSSGAGLALEAAMRGLPITKVVAYEPPYVATDDSAAAPPPDAAQHFAALTAAGRRSDAVAYFMTQMIHLPDEAVAGMRAAPMWPLLEGVAPTLAYDATVMGDYTVPAARLAALPAPTLAMAGENTTPQLLHAAHVVSASVPTGEYRVLAGQGHDVAAEAIAPVVTEFFS